MLPAPRHRYTFADYLDIEEIAGVRHEYYDGEIYAMAGGTPEHAAMAAAITAALGRQLQGGPCRVYSSDLRVRVLATGLATYPDVSVVGGPSERDPESATHVTNPKLVAEVLSDSTADYDRTEKLQHYQQIPSLETVVLVDHRTAHVEVHTRAGNVWERSSHGPQRARARAFPGLRAVGGRDLRRGARCLRLRDSAHWARLGGVPGFLRHDSVGLRRRSRPHGALEYASACPSAPRGRPRRRILAGIAPQKPDTP